MLKHVLRNSSFSSLLKERNYFYSLDEHGQLFLNDTKYKNFTTCFKDTTFLNFIFSRMKPNLTGNWTEFQYISNCGKEVNFIKVEDLPVVFHSFVVVSNDGPQPTSDVSSHSYFKWAGDLKVAFEPQHIFVSDNGRFYHPAPPLDGHVLRHTSTKLRTLYHCPNIPTTSFLYKPRSNEVSKLGLIKSSIILNQLARNFDFDKMIFNWEGKEYEINHI